MDFFSIRNAWRYGVDFLSGRMLHHTIILLGLGIIPAYCLPLLLGPSPAPAEPAPLLIAQDAFGATPADGMAAALVMALGFVLQTASYFASLRRGLGPNRSLGGAIGFGLLAGPAGGDPLCRADRCRFVRGEPDRRRSAPGCWASWSS